MRDQIQGLIEERSELREEFRRQQERYAGYLDALREEEQRQQKAKRDAQKKDQRVFDHERDSKFASRSHLIFWCLSLLFSPLCG